MNDPRSTPSILTRGAIDLGALRPTTPAAGPAAPGPAGGSAPGAGGPGAAGNTGAPSFAGAGGGEPVITDGSEATLQADVFERSMTAPVILAFYAAYSQQSVQITAMLEALAREGAGAWYLVRVDVDTNPRIAQAFRIQSVPMVYAVVGGQPVDAFQGAISEPQLRQWVAAVLAAGGVAVEVPEDPRFEAADEALVNGDLDAAEQAYKKILADAPADTAAEAGLAQVNLFRRIDGLDPQAVLDAAAAGPEDVSAQGLAADIEMLSGEAEKAYARLVDLVRRTAGAERDAARAHLISLFMIAGPDDPAVAAARRALASALY